MLNTKILTWSLGLFTAVSFLVCVAYGLIVPESLHMTGWLEEMLPGFDWLTPVGFFIGLAESFLYGVYAGLVFPPIYNFVLKRSGVTGGKPPRYIVPLFGAPTDRER
ncbi:MAG: DUF5676 family membrane protein [Gemmatimonadales bacterium]